MGIVNLENKFKMMKFEAFNKIKVSSVQNKFQRFSFSLGKSLFSSQRNSEILVQKTPVKNTLKTLVKKLEAKRRIGFLKLKLNKMKQRGLKNMKENNHLVALAMCTKALYEAKMRKIFRIVKYFCLEKDKKMKQKQHQIQQESTLIPNSDSKSNYSLSYHYQIKKNYDKNDLILLEKNMIRVSQKKEKSFVMMTRRDKDEKNKTSSKSFSIKSEQAKRDSVKSVNFNFESKTRKETELRVKKSIKLAKGLNILLKMEKNRGTEVLGY